MKEIMDELTEMIFDVARLADVGGFELGVELAEDLIEILSDNVGQNIETASMGHSHDVRSSAELSESVDQSLHARNDHFETFKTESLFGDPLFGQELFEFRRSDESLKSELLFFWGDSSGFGVFELSSDPFFLVLAGDVHEFDTDGAAVSSFQTVFNFAEREGSFAFSEKNDLRDQ